VSLNVRRRAPGVSGWTLRHFRGPKGTHSPGRAWGSYFPRIAAQDAPGEVVGMAKKPKPPKDPKPPKKNEITTLPNVFSGIRPGVRGVIQSPILVRR
jgi:hypothetical protein